MPDNAVDQAVLAGSAPVHDLSVVTLFLQADSIVKAVMLLLLLSPTTRTESISGLVLVLIGIPVFYLWRRVEVPTATGA